MTAPPQPLRTLSRRRKLAFALLTAALTGVFLFIAGETWIRCSAPIDDAGWYERTVDPILFYRLTAGKTGHDHGRPRTQTTQRVRGPFLYDAEPRQGAERVLWIGDSACFGHALSDDQTAPHRLHELASQRDRNIESINLGVVGYNARQAREVLAQRAAEFRGAQAVVYHHHENDIVNAAWASTTPYMPAGLFWEFEAPQPFHRKLLKRSALIRRFWNSDAVVRLLGPGEGNELDPAGLEAILRDRTLAVPIHPFTKLCASLYDDGSGYGVRFREELHAMADLCDAMKARLIVVYWPTRTLLHHLELDRPRQALARWCQERGIEFFDATDAFLASPASDLYIDANHPGPAGQRLIAQAVLDRLPDGP